MYNMVQEKEQVSLKSLVHIAGMLSRLWLMDFPACCNARWWCFGGKTFRNQEGSIAG